ncbi:hypothetical protein [Deinococcus soli (ex Cha et al. 2016)]|uniref:Uncharacterized protein n=2 Tax=Deinococcus soli (ex Cha et al. 2016) TaxID=1309411 RepID=A0AAE4BNG8_9DEIO|nr:hypothetical protein [Deinococcus soli (ex Cha et al. 2016)]MDR6218691.1 hypothetical protein [Deinococcus soli (ex Cha et al. 2016)]MDR6328488.1 hypothetical protein [Deinococcus soli (ex Cha et al. 2016)]MDR6753099.1 hypothetical protein [Deinococcus soli (ex Cha et al. 2016)]
MSRTLNDAVQSFLASLNLGTAALVDTESTCQANGLPAVTVRVSLKDSEPAVLHAAASNAFSEAVIVWQSDDGDVPLANVHLDDAADRLRVERHDVQVGAFMDRLQAGPRMAGLRARSKELVEFVARGMQSHLEEALHRPCPVVFRVREGEGTCDGVYGVTGTFGVAGLLEPFFTKEHPNGTLGLYRVGTIPEQIAEVRRGKRPELYGWARANLTDRIEQLLTP